MTIFTNELEAANLLRDAKSLLVKEAEVKAAEDAQNAALKIQFRDSVERIDLALGLLGAEHKREIVTRIERREGEAVIVSNAPTVVKFAHPDAENTRRVAAIAIKDFGTKFKVGVYVDSPDPKKRSLSLNVLPPSPRDDALLLSEPEALARFMKLAGFNPVPK
jgi:hypothetical protein